VCSRSFCRFLLLVAVGAAGVSASTARADAPLAPNPEAVAFFDEGRRLMAGGDYAGAIPKFEQSLKATRTVGSLLNLATCYEKVGRMASAWATYRAGAALARELHDAREADGNSFAAAVEGRVSHLTVDARAIQGVAGAEVTLDGIAVVPGSYGEAMPVDAGRHAVEVRAPGKTAASLTVDVPPDGAQATLPLPALADAPVAPTRESTSASLPAPPTPTGRRTAGYVLVGVGGASVVAGVITGMMAVSKHQEAVANCPSYPDHCNSNGSADAPNSASQTFATISTTTLIAGGVLAATGLVLVLTAPRAPKASTAVRLAPIVGVGTAGASAQVAW
jgi:hypothetical protein